MRHGRRTPPAARPVKLADLVSASSRVAATRSRSQKVAHLADALRRLAPAEVETGVAFLFGELPRGRVGVGAAALEKAMPAAARATPELALREVDTALRRVESAAGAGSATSLRRSLPASPPCLSPS